MTRLRSARIRWAIGLLMTVVFTTLASPAVSASEPRACRAWTSPDGPRHTSIEAAYAAAPAARRIRFQGRCAGGFSTSRTVRIVGVQTETSGVPTIALGGERITTDLGFLRIIGARIVGGPDAELRVEDGMVTLVDTHLVGLGASIRFGSLWMEGSSSIEGNPDGPGVSILEDGLLGMKDRAVIRDNHNWDRGGGVYAFWDAVIEMSGRSRIVGNRSDRFGGGVALRSATLRMRGRSSIAGNTAGTGGGVLNDFGSLLMWDRSSIARNHGGPGGGVAQWGGDGGGLLRMRDEASIHHNTSESGVPGLAAAGLSRGGGRYVGVRCGANVHDNTPRDCARGG